MANRSMKQKTVDPNTRLTVHAKSHLRLIALSLVLHQNSMYNDVQWSIQHGAKAPLCYTSRTKSSCWERGGRWGGGRGVEWGRGGAEEGGGGQQDYILFASDTALHQSSGAVWKSRWPSWAFRPNEPYGFCGRKATLNHAYAMVTVCP